MGADDNGERQVVRAANLRKSRVLRVVQTNA